MEKENNKTSGSVQVTVSIPFSMYKWLQEHPEINRSKLFRDAVNQAMNPHIINTNTLLQSLVALSLGVYLILISLSSFQAIYTTVILCFGVILILTSQTIFLKEVIKVARRRRIITR